MGRSGFEALLDALKQSGADMGGFGGAGAGAAGGAGADDGAAKGGSGSKGAGGLSLIHI